jgi:saccharopine dehydrogenase-like NADP-dependent oxidoreductase
MKKPMNQILMIGGGFIAGVIASELLRHLPKKVTKYTNSNPKPWKK